MYRSDVELLKADEQAGQSVVSWHTAALWDACKGRVQSDEHARRLSKMMRDNRHSLMHALQVIANAGAFTFLATLLELERADNDIEFINLRIEDHLTVFDQIKHSPRTTKYADEQKVRRCRIAFRELLTYFEKANRNSFVIKTNKSEKLLADVLNALKARPASTARLDSALEGAARADISTADAAFRTLLPEVTAAGTSEFSQARTFLRYHMDEIAREISSRWDDERYVRDLEDPGDDSE